MHPASGPTASGAWHPSLEDGLHSGAVVIGNRAVPDDEVQALIFDVDGTLLNTMPWYYSSWEVAAAEHGIRDITPAYIYSQAGRVRPCPNRPAHLG